jgi:MOSC domain-containing protein YiiM
VTSGTLLSIQVGLPARRGTEGASDPAEGAWSSAIFKDAVTGPVRLDLTNLAGDRQADLAVHGGADKAVLAYSNDHYPAWRRELRLPEMGPGAFGENFTVDGLDEESVCIGDSFTVGEALVQVSQPRAPCWKLARRWSRPDLPKRVVQTGRTGWYLRVLRPGLVEGGQPMVLVERPFPRFAIARVNGAAYGSPEDQDLAPELAVCPLLSQGWRRSFAEEG